MKTMKDQKTSFSMSPESVERAASATQKITNLYLGLMAGHFVVHWKKNDINIEPLCGHN